MFLVPECKHLINQGGAIKNNSNSTCSVSQRLLGAWSSYIAILCAHSFKVRRHYFVNIPLHLRLSTLLLLCNESQTKTNIGDCLEGASQKIPEQSIPVLLEISRLLWGISRVCSATSCWLPEATHPWPGDGGRQTHYLGNCCISRLLVACSITFLVRRYSLYYIYNVCIYI